MNKDEEREDKSSFKGVLGLIGVIGAVVTGLYLFRDKFNGHKERREDLSNPSVLQERQNQPRLHTEIEPRRREDLSNPSVLQERQNQPRLQTENRSLRPEDSRNSQIHTIPPDMICPISREKMERPMVGKCGHSFEEKAIRKWLEAEKNCPVCRSSLKTSDLALNVNLMNIIQDYKP